MAVGVPYSFEQSVHVLPTTLLSFHEHERGESSKRWERMDQTVHIWNSQPRPHTRERTKIEAVRVAILQVENKTRTGEVEIDIRKNKGGSSHRRRTTTAVEPYGGHE